MDFREVPSPELRLVSDTKYFFASNYFANLHVEIFV